MTPYGHSRGVKIVGHSSVNTFLRRISSEFLFPDIIFRPFFLHQDIFLDDHHFYSVRRTLRSICSAIAEQWFASL